MLTQYIIIMILCKVVNKNISPFRGLSGTGISVNLEFVFWLSVSLKFI